jgi:predicted AlkP superfamily pyrophosphatase or phosphodiesterase
VRKLIGLFLLCFAVVANRGEGHVILITIDGFPGRMLEDPKAHLPNLRALAAEGVSGKGMRVSNPSVTWPNHTTLVSGVRARKHSVLFNGVLVKNPADGRVKVDPEKTAAELVAVPTIFDLLHAAGLKTAGVNWPCTRLNKSLDDDIPDSPNTMTYTTPRLRSDLVAAGVLKSESQADFAKTGQPERDWIWTKTACLIVQKRMPDFMAFHLLNTDSTHHKYGPETMASYTALALADRFVGDLIEAVNATGQRAQTTFFVVADHGFAAATNSIQPNVLLRQANLLDTPGTDKMDKVRVQLISEGGTGFIYLNDAATKEEDRKRVVEMFTGKEGVQEVIEPGKFAGLGLPDSGSKGSPDLIIRPKIGFGVSAALTGDNFVAPITEAISHGYHGYIAEEPAMNALFIASGRGIKKGAKVDVVENIDVAPTIMHLFGKQLPNADGKVLKEILADR